MSPQTRTEPIEQAIEAPHWSLVLRVAFRLSFTYFGLFCLTTQILGGLFPIPKIEIPDPAALWPVRPIVFFAAAHVFHMGHPLVYTGSGSGDKTFDWVLAFCLLIFAVITTGVWSVLDRKRPNYVALHKWFRLLIRFALASEMLLYGMDKAIPLQMPFPYLTRLVEPFGNFSPMGVLWSSVGASRPYEIFAGCAEILGGVLLIVPRTTMLGALICLADLIQIFMLNMTYDVPVKLFSFHLLLMASFLLAPEIPRLSSFFFRNRATDPSTQPQLYRSRRANRIALATQIVFGLWLLGVNAYNGWSAWNTYGGGRPKSPLYGIWNVKQISIDGQLPGANYDRWRRAIFDFPTMMAVQRTDDSFDYYRASIDAGAATLTLTGNSGRKSNGKFTFQRVPRNQLTLDGNMDGQSVHIQLQLVDANKFPLVNRRFHWIQEYPANR